MRQRDGEIRPWVMLWYHAPVHVGAELVASLKAARPMLTPLWVPRNCTGFLQSLDTHYFRCFTKQLVSAFSRSLAIDMKDTVSDMAIRFASDLESHDS